MRNSSFYVYIIASKPNGTLYIGITNNLERRIWKHKNGLNSRFTKRYNVNRLVYFEQHSNINAAIEREKRMKKWNRSWKLELIEKHNPEWIDLSTNGFRMAESKPEEDLDSRFRGNDNTN